MSERTYSVRDTIYLKSTSFEVFMISGGIFVALFSLAFLIGNGIGAAWLIWPGIVGAALIALPIHLKLAQREYRAKLAELNAEYRAQEQS